MSKSVLEELSDAYETAEGQFLTAVRTASDRTAVACEARQVAFAAAAFNTEAYRRFHAKEEDAWMALDQLTERTELLSELWNDIASAYEA